MNPYPVPFDEAGFPQDPVMTVPPSKTVTIKANSPTMVSGALRVPGDAIITALWIESERNDQERSQSFQNFEPAKNQPFDPNNHFHFLPSIDKVQIRWHVENSALIVKATFEMWASAVPNSIWSLEYQNDEAVELLSSGLDSGPLPWSEVVISGDDEKYPDHCPNTANAPYLLRLTVKSKSGRVTAAWTYFDVLVDSIELHYGPATMIPAGKIRDTKDVYWNGFTQADERNLVTALQSQSTLVPANGQVDLDLRSTQAAYIYPQEWYELHDYSYLRHRARWGDGPRIPLIAKIFMKPLGNGAPVHSSLAARSLGPARFLWDWRDKIENDRDVGLTNLNAHDTAKTFIITALKYKENAAGEPPDCLNCHDDRGGKRGSQYKIFPAWNDPNAFPFKVGPATTRQWAAISVARKDGTYPCSTGIVFQPSRMALDSYQVCVMLWRPTTDVAGSVDAVLNNHSGLPSKMTAMFEVYRRIDARYIRKGPSTDPVDLDLITNMFAVGGVKVVWTREYWTQAEFKNLFNTALAAQPHQQGNNIVRNERHAGALGDRLARIQSYGASRLSNHLNIFDQWSGARMGSTSPIANASNFTVPGRDIVERPYIATAMRNFISKNRKINTVKKNWKAFRAKNLRVTEDEALVWFCQQKLSRTQRDGVEVTARGFYENDGWEGWTEVRNDDNTPNIDAIRQQFLWDYNWANQNYRYTKGLQHISQEMCHRKLMQDNFDGASFFHFTHLIQIVNTHGEVTTHQCDIGGLAATNYSADLGFRSAFAVWDHPTNKARFAMMALLGNPQGSPQKDGNYTSAHEFGHFLHLPHQKPTAVSEREKNMHDLADLDCVMNYLETSQHLCGGCALRIRGWAMFNSDGKLGFSGASPDQPGVPAPQLSYANDALDNAALYQALQ
jgi:hypothetical protein